VGEDLPDVGVYEDGLGVRDSLGVLLSGVADLGLAVGHPQGGDGGSTAGAERHGGGRHEGRGARDGRGGHDGGEDRLGDHSMFLRIARHMHVNTTPYARNALHSDLEMLCGDRKAVGSGVAGSRRYLDLSRCEILLSFATQPQLTSKSFRCFGVVESNKLLDFLASRKEIAQRRCHHRGETNIWRLQVK
jgi:hypothetical protein